MFRKLIASFFIAVFIFLSLSLTLIWGFFHTLLQEDLYSDEFISILYDYSVQEVVDSVDLEGISSISNDKFNELLKEVVTKDYLQEVITTTISDIKSLEISEENRSLDLLLPLGWLSDKESEISSRIAKYIYVEVPKCEDFSDSDENFECISKYIALDDLEVKVFSELDRSMFSKLPPDFVFTMDLPSGYTGSISDVVSKILKYSISVLILSLIFILVLIGLLIFKPFISIIKWQSLTVFISSLLISILFILLYSVSGIWEVFTVLAGSELGTSDINFFSAMYDYLVKELSSNVLSVSVPFVIFSLIFLLYTIIRPKLKNEQK